jgi:hypothetical protein
LLCQEGKERLLTSSVTFVWSPDFGLIPRF